MNELDILTCLMNRAEQEEKYRRKFILSQGVLIGSIPHTQYCAAISFEAMPFLEVAYLLQEGLIEPYTSNDLHVEWFKSYSRKVRLTTAGAQELGIRCSICWSPTKPVQIIESVWTGMGPYRGFHCDECETKRLQYFEEQADAHKIEVDAYLEEQKKPWRTRVWSWLWKR